MKKSGVIVLIILVLMISIISFVNAGSSIGVAVRVTGRVIEDVTVTGDESNEAETNETETNETTNETEIEYTDEELVDTIPEAGITPDSALYGMDVFVDNVRATLTPSSLGKAKVRLDIMGERMAEMEQMAKKNKAEEAKKAGLQAQKQMRKFEGSVEKIKKIKKKDAEELKEHMQRNAKILEILKQRLIDYDSDWADAILDALEIMKTSEHMIANIPEDFDLKPSFEFSPGTSTFESMIAQCIESGETQEECEKIEDFCKELRATTAKDCVAMLSSGFLTPTFRTYGPGERPPDPHNCSGFHSSYITQKKYCCEDTDEDHSTEHREKTDDRSLDYYYIKGTVDYKVINLRTDEIEHEIFTDSCDGNTLTEWECAQRDRMLSEEYDCPYGCQDGACITCNSDSICDENEDCSCSDCEGKRNGCKGFNSVCRNGECVYKEVVIGGVPEEHPEPPGEMQVAEEEFEGECIDSDGGMDYSTKGIITISGHSVREDYCDNNSWLIEYFCGDNNMVSSIPYSCLNGCEDGVCV